MTQAKTRLSATAAAYCKARDEYRSAPFGSKAESTAYGMMSRLLLAMTDDERVAALRGELAVAA